MSFTSIVLSEDYILLATGHREDALITVDRFTKKEFEPEKRREALRDILEQDIDENDHICICTDGYCETKIMAMPEMAAADAQKVIEFDREKYLPWKEECKPPIIDIVKRSPSEISKEEGMMDVYMVAIPHESALFMARMVIVAGRPLDIITYCPGEQIRFYKEWEDAALINFEKDYVDLYYWNQNIIEEHERISNSPAEAAEILEKWHAKAMAKNDNGLQGVALSWNRNIPVEEREKDPNYEDWLAIVDEFGENGLIPLLSIPSVLERYVDRKAKQDQMALGGLIRGLLEE